MNTMTSSYLPLTEYSSKYKVSISTLRRRIKADDIKYVFEDGKYLIMDEPVGTHQKVHRPSQSSEQTFLVEMPPEPSLPKNGPVASPRTNPSAPLRQVTESPRSSSSQRSASGSMNGSVNGTSAASSVVTMPAMISETIPTSVSSQWHAEIQGLSQKEHHEPILTAANRLLTELKKAYTQVLQEKEEQILHLREENTDLRTLVRVLESDNERYKR